jgi:chromosome segregation ATPase
MEQKTMGRNPKITYQQVVEAAEALKAAGFAPTVKAVRKQLGNIGSTGTISHALRTWKAEHQPPVANSLVLPPSIQRALLDFAAEEHLKEKRVIEEKLAFQVHQVTELANLIERQTASIAARDAKVMQLEKQCATCDGRMKQMEIDAIALRNELITERETGEIISRELETKTRRLEELPRLKADLSAAENALKKEHFERVTAEQQVAVLSTKLDAAEKCIARAEATATDMANQISQATAAHRELATANGRFQVMETHFNQQLQGIESMRMEVLRAREEAAVLKGRLAAMEPAEQSSFN